MDRSGDVPEKPHAVVELSGLAHQPEQIVDRIDATNLRNQVIDDTGDPDTGIAVNVRAESVDRDGIAAFSQAAASDADMELSVHSTVPQINGLRGNRL